MSDEVIECQPATTSDMFYVGVGEQMVKDSLSNLNQSLRHVVTLSAGLFFGTVAISKERIAHHGVIVTCMVMLLVALAISAFGLIPHESAVEVRCPESVREAIDSGTTHKKNILYAAAVIIFMALTIMLIGVLAMGATQ